MNALVNAAGTAISTDLLTKLKSGIAESRATTVIAGGKPILRMLRDGQWVYGQKNDIVQENSSWAINPLSIGHGWVCWTNHVGAGTKNSMVGEVMAPVHEPKPPRPANVDNWPFTEQRIFDLRCMDGEDAGVEVMYKNNSLGGMQAVDKLLGELQDQLNKNPAFPCPVVQFFNDSYPHQKYGKIYVPIFAIQNWVAELPEEAMAPVLVEAPANSKKAAPKKTVKAASKRV